jgi:putative ABC transport system permease protein
MRWLTQLQRRARAIFRSARVEDEMDAEIRYHLDRQIEVNLASGMTPEQARLAALREFGGVDQRREECRDARGVSLIESLRQDASYALRSLRKSPGFTVVAVLSLALGIGANTTIFSFVNAVLLRPLPYPESNRLVTLREQPADSATTVAVHPQNFLEWGARSRSFEALALVQVIPTNLLAREGAEQITVAQTTAELFRAFGVTPAMGRMFTEPETRPDGPPVAVLSYDFWQRQFKGDPSVLGRRLELSDGHLTVIGVAPEGLRIGAADPDAYVPLIIDPANPGAIGSRSFECYGRLRPGVSLDAARAEMTVIAAQLARQYSLDRGYGVSISILHDYLVKEGRPALRLLMAVVAMVLVIACVNLAGLLMARGLGRRAELALRTSLGATRLRLVRQLVIESLVLASLGGLAGLVVAWWATRGLVALTQDALSVGTTGPISIDGFCLLFTLGVSAVTAIAFGLIPAWQASQVDPQVALGERARGGTADRRHHRLRSGLVVAEVALAVVLLVGAGLLLRTFASLSHVPLGFEPAHTLTLRLFLGDRDPAYRIGIVDQILERVAALPGVEAASTIQFLPLSGMRCGTGFWLDGQTIGDENQSLATDCSVISRDYFKAMGVPVLEGRGFDRRDRLDSPRVVVVNRSFAREYFKDGHALGQRVTVAGPGQQKAEIVGITGDVRHNGLAAETVPTVFLLHAQTPGYITSLVVRTTGEPASMAQAIRRAIQDVDRTQGVSGVRTMEEYLGASLARPRLYAALVAGFAILALTLAMLGVYGLIAYVVSQRTHEIGIRMALGAERRRVFIDVFSRGVLLTVTGLAAGIASALALARLTSSLLYGVTSRDPITYTAAGVGLLFLALLATAIPARRASRVEPMSALRYE